MAVDFNLWLRFVKQFEVPTLNLRSPPTAPPGGLWGGHVSRPRASALAPAALGNYFMGVFWVRSHPKNPPYMECEPPQVASSTKGVLPSAPGGRGV